MTIEIQVNVKEDADDLRRVNRYMGNNVSIKTKTITSFHTE